MYIPRYASKKCQKMYKQKGKKVLALSLFLSLSVFKAREISIYVIFCKWETLFGVLKQKNNQ